MIRFKLDKLPENLKAIRRSRKLSQRQVADILGFKSAATIAHYENGNRSIPLSILSRMVYIYGFDVVFQLKAAPNKAINADPKSLSAGSNASGVGE